MIKYYETADSFFMLLPNKYTLPIIFQVINEPIITYTSVMHDNRKRITEYKT